MPVTMLHTFLLTEQKSFKLCQWLKLLFARWNLNNHKFKVFHAYRETFRTIIQKLMGATTEILGAIATWYLGFAEL
jgi:hypothetical protein